MTVLTVESPTLLRINSEKDPKHLKTLLQYHDKRVDFAYQRLRNNRYAMGDREKWEADLQALRDNRIKSLLFEDEKGFWTYSGLAGMLQRSLGAELRIKVEPPPRGKDLPWAEPPFKPHPYQEEALEKLWQQPHAGVEMGTGLGKTLIIAYLIWKLGLKTVVMAPSVSIASQIYDLFVRWMGKRYVGFYGDGRKDVKKLVTVAIAASLTRVEEGSPAWKALSQAKVLVCDESHLCAAATLARVCFGLMASAPYRYFFSATQMRNDGADLLLEGITGPIVYSMSVRQGIDAGYLAKLAFTMVSTQSRSNYESKDANEMTRRHLFYNPGVNTIVGKLANGFCQQGRQVLILVDEIQQFNCIYPHFLHGFDFAHACKDRAALSPRWQRPDVAALVQSFNEGRLPILVGTSCISTGTDIKANQVTINLRGGKSEIEVMQGPIGRSTRLHPSVGKTSCDVIDFNVANIPLLRRHALERQKIYNSVYGPVKEWRLGS